MTISQGFLPEFDQELASTRRVLERVPEDKLDWRPHEKSMTLGRLAGHVAETAEWAIHTLTSDGYEIVPRDDGTYVSHSMQSREDTLQKFDQWVKEAREALSATTDEAWPVIWNLTSKGQTFLSMPRIAAFRGMVLNHMIHHRGQLTVYLRLNGVPVPGMYGPSADETA